jgi:hypothetical protein
LQRHERERDAGHVAPLLGQNLKREKEKSVDRALGLKAKFK